MQKTVSIPSARDAAGPDGGDSVIPVKALVERSADLKAELLAFARGRRYMRRLDAAIAEVCDEYGFADENDVIAAMDRFLLQRLMADGRALPEIFVAQRSPALPPVEHDMVLGWRDVVESTFEITSVQTDECAVMLHNLVDDLVYRVYSNAGRGVVASLRRGMFLACRIVPVHPAADAWLFSGSMVKFRKSDGPRVARALLPLLAGSPLMMRRNPDLLRQAWHQQVQERADFIEVFGSDMVILPPPQAAQKLTEFRRHRQEKILAALDPRTAARVGRNAPTPEQLSELTDDLLDAESIGLIYDEEEGLNYFADLGRLDSLYADPRLMRDRGYRSHLRSYLNDDSVSPLAFRRLAQRHPEGVDAVFRALLGKPGFSWERDGETLLRRRKKDFYDREPMPSITIVPERLAALARA